MSIKRLELIDPSGAFYNLKDKLANHVLLRSEEAFANSKEKRDAINSKEELRKHADNIRKNFIDSLDGLPYDKSLDLNAKVTKVTEDDFFKIEHIIFTSRPGVYVTANFYIPKKRKEKCGAVLFQPGHASDGKAYTGYQKVIRSIASCGLCVLAIDPIGQGERLSYMEKGQSEPRIPACTAEHQHAGEQCVLCGDSIARYFIADAMRAVDYLETRPEIDPNKIGATGSSGGGTATSHMMICDDRIKAAAPGTFVTSKQEYFHAGGAQDSEQIWFGGGTHGIDHHEILLSFAPKPTMLLTVDSDFFVIDGAKDVMNDCSRFWEMHDKKDDLKIVIDRSVHCYTEKLAENAARFFSYYLNGEQCEPIKEATNPYSAEKLNCTKSGQIKFDFEDAKFPYDENFERLNEFKKQYNKEEAKKYLRACVDFGRKPIEITVRRPRGSIYHLAELDIEEFLWFTQKQMPTHALGFSNFNSDNKNMPVVIYLTDDGTNDIESHIYKIKKLCAENKRVLLVDLAGVGKNDPHPLNHLYYNKERYGAIDKLTKDLFYLGDSLCALRLFELEKVKDVIISEFGTDDISYYAEGKSSILLRLLTLLHEDAEIAISNSSETLSQIAEQKYYNSYNCSGYLLPGILKYIEI